jgi:hypothetical protein
VGPATLTFAGTNNGTFTYTVNGVTQTKAITRQVFGVLPVCTWGALADLTLATNYTDMWWVVGGAESGWGINFTDQTNADLRHLVHVRPERQSAAHVGDAVQGRAGERLLGDLDQDGRSAVQRRAVEPERGDARLNPAPRP